MKWSKADRLAIRKEMLKQAEEILSGLYARKAQLRSAARVMGDKAIA